MPSKSRWDQAVPASTRVTKRTRKQPLLAKSLQLVKIVNPSRWLSRKACRIGHELSLMQSIAPRMTKKARSRLYRTNWVGFSSKVHHRWRTARCCTSAGLRILSKANRDCTSNWKATRRTERHKKSRRDRSLMRSCRRSDSN